MKPFFGNILSLVRIVKIGRSHCSEASGLYPDAIDKHAGWRSKSCKFRYVSDLFASKLSISGAIGL